MQIIIWLEYMSLLGEMQVIYMLMGFQIQNDGISPWDELLE